MYLMAVDLGKRKNIPMNEYRDMIPLSLASSIERHGSVRGPTICSDERARQWRQNSLVAKFERNVFQIERQVLQMVFVKVDSGRLHFNVKAGVRIRRQLHELQIRRNHICMRDSRALFSPFRVDTERLVAAEIVFHGGHQYSLYHYAEFDITKLHRHVRGVVEDEVERHFALRK